MMMRKSILLFIALLLVVIVNIDHGESSDTKAVIHQHQVYQQEQPEQVGLKKDGNLVTHLPLLIIENNGKNIPGAQAKSEAKLACDYRLIDYDGKMNASNDRPTQEGHILISIRGNSSRMFDKKQYAIQCVNQQGEGKAQQMMGMPAHDNWVLNGSFIDRSMIRNYMLYNISNELMSYAPRCRLCEVMLTDETGKVQYQGVYTMIEKPKVSNERLALEKYNAKYAPTSFLLQMNAVIDHIEVPHLKPDNIDVLYPMEIVYPAMDEITVKSVRYIRDRMITFEKMLYDASMTKDFKEVNKAIDLDSFVDYYLINEYFQNYDAGRRSTYLYANVGGKITIGPVWDFDSSFNNFRHESMEVNWLDLKSTFYYTYLIQNPEFNKRCVNRYFELRNSYFSDDYIINYIDDCKTYLASSAARNEALWYEEITQTTPNPGFHWNKGEDLSFEKDIEEMKSYIVKRGTWLDEHFLKLAEIYQ